MGKITLFFHTTIDGFVADADGGLGWASLSEELFSYVGQRIGAASTALYGRKTFEMMEGYWPTAADQPYATKHDIEHASWYKTVHKVVISNTLPSGTPNGPTVIGENLASEIKQLRDGTDGEIPMFASPTAAHELMAQDLVDGYWLFVHPVILGSGTPLFVAPHSFAKVRLVDSHAFENGVVCLDYERKTD